MSQIERYRSRMTPDNLWPASRSALQAEGQLLETVDPEATILVWKSSGRHPMDDMLAAWLVLGYITEEQAAATSQAREEADKAFFAEYMANPPQLTAEDYAEMRAAFGPGERVVNVVTGQEYDL